MFSCPEFAKAYIDAVPKTASEWFGIFVILPDHKETTHEWQKPPRSAPTKSLYHVKHINAHTVL
jgi:hypothetical protein